jgi:hypothetical protein
MIVLHWPLFILLKKYMYYTLQRKNTDTLIDASNQAGLEINIENRTLLSRHQNAGQNRDIIIANRSFENVLPPRYSAMAVSDQNSIHKEIKSRLYSDNACYNSLQNLLCSSILFKKEYIRIYGIKICLWFSIGAIFGL